MKPGRCNLMRTKEKKKQTKSNLVRDQTRGELVENKYQNSQASKIYQFHQNMSLSTIAIENDALR